MIISNANLAWHLMEGENKGGKESLENFCFALMLDVDHVDAEEEEVESWH